jgi:hypothetical protein
MFKFFKSLLGSEENSKDIQATRYIEAQHDLNADYIRSQQEFMRDFHSDAERHAVHINLYPAFSVHNEEVLTGKHMDR